MSNLHRDINIQITPFSSTGSVSRPITNRTFSDIDKYITNSFIDTIIPKLDRAKFEDEYNGYSNEYNNVTIYMLVRTIIKLYVYFKDSSVIANFDEFIVYFNYTKVISKLMCYNIDIKQIIIDLEL